MTSHNIDDMSVEVLGVSDREQEGVVIIEDILSVGGLIRLLVDCGIIDTSHVVDGTTGLLDLLILSLLLLSFYHIYLDLFNN